jgi:hypothetical protein
MQDEHNHIYDGLSYIAERHNHSHFWIREGVLYESYHTLRGMRYMEVMEVHGMPDEDKCSDACLNYIRKEYIIPDNQS